MNFLNKQRKYVKQYFRKVFGSGTAAIISPVGKIKYCDKVLTINNEEVGSLSNRFFNAIMDIQYGRCEDKMGWIDICD